MGITRSSIIRKAVDELQIMPMPSPEMMAKEVSLVYPVNIKHTDVFKATNATSTSDTTFYTTPTDKDFFITYLSLAVTKDAANDNTLVYVKITKDGAATVLLPIQFLTTTAAVDHAEISFPYPLKCDRGTGIVIVGSFTAGTMSKRACVGGYILE